LIVSHSIDSFPEVAMSRSSPSGPRQWCACVVPIIVVCGLCVALTACGTDPSRGAKPTEGRWGGAKVADAPAESLYDSQKREDYVAVTENPFQSVKSAPLSTFSADVNTASYSNIRRYLNQGQRPPRDSVLLAEMVNYFPYRYPQPKPGDPASVTVDAAPCPWQARHHLVRIGVRARTFDPAEMPPRNLVFLIDTSGSMDGATRLPLVKESLDLLVAQLTERDRVTIVTYAGEAGVRLPSTPGNRKETIRAAIHSLRAGGSTNGEGGIRVAYEQATRSFIEGGVNRVILCTDGDFNVGAQNQSDLLQLIERKRTSRVFLTVLGYGMGNLKNATMELLANHGNGHYAYIDSIDEARKVFVEQGGALAVVAKDVKLQVEFNPARVAAYRLIGYENRLLRNEDFKNDAKDAGDMGSGHTVTALYEIVPVGVSIDLPDADDLKYQKVEPKAKPTKEWLTVKMRYKEPDGDVSKEVSAVLPDGAEKKAMPEDFRFATAVVEFGLLLRDSPHKGSASYTTVLERAGTSSSFDPNGHRAEFIQLVRRAAGLSGVGEK
jgi:Ca-activated chloride channel family protein